MFEEQYGNNYETITVVSLLFINLVIHCHRLALRICVFSTVMECNIGFSSFKKFYIAVNTFFKARDMHCFSIIWNKIQVKDVDNDLSIGNNFDKSSESERKEAYEKASLDQEESKDKQDIFLENNPKNMDEIIKAMTPKTLAQEQMKLLEIHDQKKHCVPIK